MVAKASDMHVKCTKAQGKGQYINGTFMMDVCLSNEQSVNQSKGVVVHSPEAAIEARKLRIPIAIAPTVDLPAKAIL
jgi:hypothetical protein